MSNYWDLFPLSSTPAQPFTWPVAPWLLPGGQQGIAARQDASWPISSPLGWPRRADDPAGLPAISGGVLGTVPHVHDAEADRLAREVEDARRALALAMWLGPPSRGPVQAMRGAAANPAPSMNTSVIPVAATGAAPPPRPAGPQAPPLPPPGNIQGQAPPRSRYWQAQHGIDTGPAPLDRDEALARTANTRRLASEGWQAGFGDEPIFPHKFAGADTQFRGVPNWLQPDARALWNAATLPASWLDTGLRTARGAYLGAIGGVAGAAGDTGLARDPDELARAMPEMINVLGAATAQPELKFLPRFPVTTMTRFAAKHPVEAVAGTGQVLPKVAAEATRLMHPGAGEASRTADAPLAASPALRDAAFYNAPKLDAPFPQYATEYPPVGPATLVRKSDGKAIEGVSASDAQRMVDAGEAYWRKTLTPDAEVFKNARLAIIRDMEENGYTPYFDPAQRFHVDPADYPTTIDTRDVLPKKQQTIDKHTALMDTPEVRARLQAAYDLGRKTPDTDNWFAMGQLRDAFIRELGPDAGRAAFKRRFADGMAATTGGADPRSNYLMTQYANYLDVHGLPTPSTHELPYPIGGRFAGSNIGVFDRTVRNPDWTGFDASNPKRHDFSYGFLGHRDKSPIDEQITGAILPGRTAPPGKSYGIGARIMHDLAEENGVSPQSFEQAVWAGLKRQKEEARGRDFNYQGPMINQINDAIERTHRLTGMSRDEIVRRGSVRSEIPIYGLGGAAVGLPWLFPSSNQSGS